MGGKGVPGGDTLANFSNSLLAEGQGTRRETQRRANEALQGGTVSGGARPILNQRLIDAFGAISQGLTNQRGQLQAAGLGRSSAALQQMGDMTQQGFLEASKVPTGLANEIANQGVSASFGSIPTISSGFAAKNQLGLSEALSSQQLMGGTASGLADIINSYAQIRSSRYTPPQVPAAPSGG